MKKFQNILFSGIVLLALVLMTFVSSCQIGLGNTVDIEPPTVSIVSPETGLTFNGSFELKGTWTDDSGVEKVIVTIVNTKTAEVMETITIPISVVDKKGDWVTTIDTSKYADDTYKVKVVALDAAQRESAGTSERSYDFDNSAPVLLVTKPNSLSFVSPANYGRSIKLKGTISDVHDISKVNIKVFEALPDGSKGDEIVLPKSEFTNVTKGDFELTLAQYYSSSSIPDEGVIEYQLYKNFLALYGDNSAENAKWNTNQKYLFEVTATDNAGNTSSCGYIKTPLNSLLQVATGNSQLSLSCSDYVSILNGSYVNPAEYSMEKTLSEDQKATIKEVLTGKYDQSSLPRQFDYFADSDSMMYFSINSKANPTYEIYGYKIENENWVETSVESSITIKVAAGLDETEIYPDTLSVTIIPCEDETGVASSDSVIKLSQDCIKDTNGTSVKDIGTSVTTGSYTVYLNGAKDVNGNNIALKSGRYYRVIVEGKDINENELIAAYSATGAEYVYGFKTSTISSQAIVEFAEDAKYKKASELLTVDSVSKTASIKITETTAEEVTVNAFVYYTEGITTFGKGALNVPEHNVISNKVIPLTYGEAVCEVPLKFESITDGKNYTIGIYMVVINGDARTEKIFHIYADNAAPVLSYKGKLQTAKNNGYVVGNITESDTLFQKEGDSFTYTINGSWSDINGSGTDKLYYTTADVIDDDTVWSVFETEEAPQSDTLLNWTKTIPVAEGGPTKLNFKAIDLVGNESDVETFTGLYFDYAEPTVTLEGSVPAEYYKENPTFTVKASDTNKITDLLLTIKKDNVEVSAADYAAKGVTVTDVGISADSKTLTKKITFTEDGKWSVVAKGKDVRGRTTSNANAVSFTTVLDKVAPAWKDDASHRPTVGSLEWNAGDKNWYNATSLKFTGFYDEETSGIDHVEYKVYPAGSAVEPKPDNFSTKDLGTYESFTTTLDGFVASNSANRVVLTPCDKAGNKGLEKEFLIYVDSASPTLETESYEESGPLLGASTKPLTGTIYTRKQGALILRGSIKDDASGFNNESVEIKVGGVAAVVEVDTTSTGLSATNARWTATISKAILDSLNEGEKTSITATVRDGAGNSSSSTIGKVEIDTTKPVINFKNSLLNATKNGYKVGTITEADSLFQKNGSTYNYTISGSWTDNGGSGTKTLSYSIDGGNSWVDFDSSEAPVSDSLTNWSKTLTVSEGELASLWIKAEDEIGNETDPVKFTNIYFDYSVPTVVLTSGTTDEYTKTAPTYVITGNDTNELKSLDVVVKKNGAEVVSGNGFTLTTVQSPDKKTITATVKVTEEAVWEISAKATDILNRVTADSNCVKVKTTYDKTAPEWKEVEGSYVPQVGGLDWDSNDTSDKWFNATSLKFDGFYDEAVSGIDQVDWYVKPAGSVSRETGSFLTTDKGSYETFSVTLYDLVSSSDFNEIGLTPKDKAGNVGETKVFKIFVDSTAPYVTPDVDSTGTIFTNRVSPITLKGNITDDASGFNASSISIKVGTVNLEGISVDTTSAGLSKKNAKWTVNIPVSTLNQLTAGKSTDVKVTVKDLAGNTVSDTSICKINVDITPPVIEYKNKLKQSQDNGWVVGWTTEADSLFQKAEVGIAQGGDTDFVYTVSGSWSDIGGSGTKTLEYKINSKPWTEFGTDEAPQLDSKTNWTKMIYVAEGGPYSLRFRAKDAAGNQSTEDVFTDSYFDFSAPEVVLSEGTVDAYTKTAPTYKVTATDTNKLQELIVTIKKNGRLLNENEYASSGVAVVKVASDIDRKITATIKITEEGEWVVAAKATDIANRESNVYSFETIYDKTAPEWREGAGFVPKVGGRDWDSTNPSDSWYNASSLKFEGYFAEELSGVDQVNWYIQPAGTGSDVSKRVTGSFVTTDKGNYETFSATLDGFVSKSTANIVGLTPVDKAGNSGVTKTFNIFVDSNAPSLTSNENGTIYTNKSKELVLTGTITDDASGFTDGSLVITIGSNTATVTLDTTSAGKSKTNADWKATIPVTVLNSLTAGQSTDVKATVTDTAGNKLSSLTLCKINVDTTGPVITFKNSLLTAQSNSGRVGQITEADAMFQKVSSTYTYTINGSWSDIGGSGTKTLSYSIDGGSSWVDFETSEAPKSDTLSNWSKALTVEEGRLASLWIKGIDDVGNSSTIHKFTDFYFDYSVPSVSLTSSAPAEYYKTNPLFTVEATDTNAIDDILVVAKKNGVVVNTGYAVNKSTSDDGKTLTANISISSDGVWSILVKGQDGSTPVRETPDAQALTINTTVDKVAPVWNEDDYTAKVGGNAWHTLEQQTNHSWFRSSSLKFEGYYDEEVSGIDRVDWYIQPAGTTEVSDRKSGSFETTDKGTYEAFNTTLDGFVASNSENTVHLTPYDKAGNVGAEKVFSIYVDEASPTSTCDQSGTVLTNKVNTITLSGTAEDDASGIKSVTIKIGTLGNVNATINPVSAGDYRSVRWTATVSSTILNKLSDGSTYDVFASIEDNAGNTNSSSVVKIAVDTTAPVVTISTPINSASLNGKADITGKVSEISPASFALYYATRATETLTNGELSSDWTKIFETTNAAEIYNWSTAAFDFTAKSNASSKADGISTIYLLPVAKDSAGNCNIYTTGGTSLVGSQKVTYTVDLNSDRPVIKFNEIEDASGTLRTYTKSISGSIADDDTITSFKIYATTNASDPSIPNTAAKWLSYTQQGSLDWEAGSTSFTYDPTHIAQDGIIYTYYYLKDSDGGEFFTGAANTLKQPKIRFKKAASEIDNSSVISYKTDSNQPVINQKYYYSDSTSAKVTGAVDGSYVTIPSSITVGGKKKKFLILRVQASDDNGIKSITGEIAGKTLTFTNVDAVNGWWKSNAIDVSSIASDSYTTSLVVTDNSSLTGTATFTTVVDNDGPIFNKINPPSDLLQTGDVSVSGSVQDTYSTVVVSKYMVVTNAIASAGYTDAALYTTMSAISAENQENSGTPSAFEFDFDGVVNQKLPSTTSELEAYSNFTTDEQVYDIPVYFMAEDELGNYSVNRSYAIHYNPFQDRPTTEVIYPETGSTLSGSIRLSGSATDNESVKEVYYQVMPSTLCADHSSNEAMKTAWANAKNWAKNTLGLPVVDASNFAGDKNFDADTGFWGIKATGTVSWYSTINGSPSLQIESTKEPGDTGNYLITVRAIAVDNNQTLGNWSAPVDIILNPNSPTFGSTVIPSVKQFSDAALSVETSSQDIQGTEIYLKGEWYYVTSVTHTNGISEVSYSIDGGETKVLVSTASNGKTTINDSVHAKQITNGYKLIIPLGTGTGSGSRIVKIDATNKNGVPGSITAPFYYDNAAPVIDSLYQTDNETEFTNGSALSNSNNQLVIGGMVSDETAGVSKVLFYFYREESAAGKNRRVYDPMFNYYKEEAKSKISVKDASGNDVTTGGLSHKTIDGMPLYGYTYNVTRPSEDAITLSSANVHIREGGLVLIGGTYHRISDVNGNTVQITPTCPTNYKEAFFPIAQVVDNTRAESIKSFTTTGVEFKNNSDDGDGMPESLSGLSTSKTWEASIHGDWIPDGPVTFVMFAFDSSENIAATSVTASIQNNRPRLSKVFLGTDLDKSNTYGDNEFETYNILGVTGEYQETYDLTTAGFNETKDLTSSRKAFKVKNKLAIVPEFTGGNGEIKVIFNNNDTTTGDDGHKSITDSGFTSSLKAKTGTLDGAKVKGNYYEFKGTELGSDSASKRVSFTFWDSTDLTTCGKDSQYCFLRVTDLHIVQTDSVKPNVKVDPFYWKNFADNSLYQNDKKKGHIELEADWLTAPGYDSAATNGQYDKDPKVSGTIVVRGTSYDDSFLSNLYFNVTNSSGANIFAPGTTEYTAADGKTYYLAATYADSNWTPASSNIANGWTFEVDDDEENGNYFGQDGHKIHWALSIDTSRIVNSVGSDISVNVVAKDISNNNSAGRTVSDSVIDNTGHKPSYRMDVVPYITNISTVLSNIERRNPSVYGRTALGKYPVYYYTTAGNGSAKGETVAVEGFNITAGATVTMNGTTATLDANKKYTINSSASSGQLSVTESGIVSVNNINNNEAKGSAKEVLSVDNYARYAYNRCPNEQNNELLTDDVELAVWTINAQAGKGNSGDIFEVDMHVNPKNGLVGMAFAHSAVNASFPNGFSNSYENWAFGWTSVNTIEFSYDQQGYAHGTNAGTDTARGSNADGSNNKASRFRYIYTKWGSNSDLKTQKDWMTCYGKRNALRVEYMAVHSPSWISKERRFPNPKVVANVIDTDNDGDYDDEGKTNVYMMYLDTITNELKFKAGAMDNTAAFVQNGGVTNDTNLWKSATTEFGDFKDTAINNNSNYVTNYDYVSVVANADNTTAGVGDHYAIAVVPGTNTTTDTVVAVWYDEGSSSLWYSYIEDPIGNRRKNINSTTHVNSSWHTPVKILDGNASGYCAIAVDEDKHVHIASSTKGRLCYTYLNAYNSTYNEDVNTVAVDSYGSPGWYLTMDFAKDSEGHTIPYIGYYHVATQFPRYAYLVDTASADATNAAWGTAKWVPKAGADSNNEFTGAWECVTLPTQSSITLDDMNIGVWKYLKADSTHIKGEIRAIPTQNSSSNTGNSGIVGGNGSLNPIMGYGITYLGRGYVETAQLK